MSRNRSYPNLAASNSGTNATPWRFIVPNNFQCGGTINFTLTVNYSSGQGRSQTFNFSITPTLPYGNFYSENFDGVTAPNLPAGWTTDRTGNTPPAVFATAASNSDTTPNAVFTNGSGTIATNSLISPSITLPAGQPDFQLSFRQTRNFEGSTAQNESFDGRVFGTHY